MSTPLTQGNRPQIEDVTSLPEDAIDFPEAIPSSNVSASSPPIKTFSHEEADHSTAKNTTSDQSHSLETNISPLSHDITPKALEFSPASESEVFSLNKDEDDRPR